MSTGEGDKHRHQGVDDLRQEFTSGINSILMENQEEEGDCVIMKARARLEHRIQTWQE